MASRLAVDKGYSFSTKHKRPIRQRLRQMRKLIPNTYLMRIYDADGKYLKTVLIQLGDVVEDDEGVNINGETEGQETCETQSEGTTESYEDTGTTGGI